MIRAAWLAALVAVSFGAHAADLGVAQLFEMLGKQKPSRATYVERKYLSLLDKPVESRGELSFVPPDRLEKRTTAPKNLSGSRPYAVSSGAHAARATASRCARKAFSST